MNSYNLLKNKSILDKFSIDASIFRIVPEAVFIPDNIYRLIDFVKDTLNYSSKSITIRSAGTCMSGGPINHDYIVSMTENINQVEDFNIKEKTITVQPGMYFRDLLEYTMKYNLYMPAYPASKDLCTIGGMIMNNSGGENTLKYGKTVDYVIELDMICQDGNVYTFKELKGKELDAVIKHDKTFYGDIHRKILRICKENKDTIRANTPTVSKNSSGYNIFKVYNAEENSLNLVPLICGSQGTLGVLLRAKLRLIEYNDNSQMAVFYLKNFTDMTKVISHVLPLNPQSFEVYDDHTFKIAMKYLPSLLMRMKGNIFKLAYQFLPELYMILRGDIPKVIMLAEWVEPNEKTLELKMSKLINSIKDLDDDIEVLFAENEDEMEKYWTFRRESFNLLRSKLKDLRTAPFIEDVVVPNNRLETFIPEFEQILDEEKMLYTIAGHVGDGNLHVIPLMRLRDNNTIKQIERLSDKVYQLIQKYHGSLSGEHNDGLLRSAYFKYMFDDNMIRIFKEIKLAFDPAQRFNPNKKIGVSLDYAKKYIDRRV